MKQSVLTKTLNIKIIIISIILFLQINHLIAQQPEVVNRNNLQTVTSTYDGPWKNGIATFKTEGSVVPSTVFSNGVALNLGFQTQMARAYYSYNIGSHINISNFKLIINSLMSSSTFGNNKIEVLNNSSAYYTWGTLPNDKSSKSSWTSPILNNPTSYISSNQIFFVNSVPASQSSEFDKIKIQYSYNDDPLTLTPSSGTYGNVEVGKSGDIAFALSNTDATPISCGTSITGTNANEFSIISVSESISPLSGNGLSTITVRFSPLSKGIKSGTLNITAGAPAISKTVPLSGTGCGIPNPPTNVIASRNLYGKISISWTDASTDESGFHVYRIGTKIADPTSSPYDDLNPATCQDISYQVSSYNSYGESSRITSSATGKNLAFGSVTVTLTPSDAVNDGAKWRLSSESVSARHNSGESVNNLQENSYTIYYYDSPLWKSPSSTNVAVTCGQSVSQSSPNYSRKTFGIIVSISPSDVIALSKWRLTDETQWHSSGESIDRTPGNYTLTFQEVVGWTKPNDIPVTIVSSNLTIPATYLKASGRVSGYVTSNPPSSIAIGGVDVRLRNTSFQTKTNQLGYYEFIGINYGSYNIDVAYTDINNKTHTFLPPSMPVDLNSSIPNADNKNFIDISTITIIGTLIYGNTNCPVSGVPILVNGGDIGIKTDAYGKYSANITIGKNILTPQLQGHTFNPSSIDENFLTNQTRDFKDLTQRNLSISIKGSCNNSLGQAEITIASKLSNCFQLIKNTDANGILSIDLPPLLYTVIAKIPLKNITSNSFEVDLSTSSQIIPIIIKGKLIVDVTGLPTEPNCPTPYAIKKGQTKNILINLYEDYGETKCPSSGSTLYISDGVASPEKKIQINVIGSNYQYDLKGGDPNVNVPYTKRIEISAQKSDYASSEKFTTDIVVLGSKFQGQSFATISPQLPLLLLHVPNGDKSRSFVESSYESQLLLGLAFEGSLGAEISASASADLGFNGEIGGSVDVTSTLKTDLEYLVTKKTTQRYSTISNSDSRLIGPGYGDVYGGAALNLIYGIEDIVEIKNCQVEKNQRLAWGTDGFKTSYLYTHDYIKNNLIPLLAKAGKQEDVSLWNNILGTNVGGDGKISDTELPQVKFIENKSFSGGTSFTYEKLIENTKKGNIDFNIELSSEIATKFGLKVLGNGAEGKVKVHASYKIGGYASTTLITTTKSGYILEDNDAGDVFSVDVYEDKLWGTPIFILKSAQTSCPAENNSLARQKVKALIFPSEEEVLISDPAKFNLKISNESPTLESWTYRIAPIQSTNNCGVTIKINGQTVENGIEIGPIKANNTDSLSVTIEGGTNITNPVCENLKLRIFSDCDGQIADTVSMKVRFIQKCGESKIIAPSDGIIIDKNSHQSIDVVTDYLLTSFGNPTKMTLEYLIKGQSIWHQQTVITNPTKFPISLPWNISTLDTGKYLVRCLSECPSGIAISQSISISLKYVTDVKKYSEIPNPENFQLVQNFPNPFNPSTTIRYGLPTSCRVLVQIFNTLGQKVAILVNKEQSAGWYEAVWTPHIPSGIYFYGIEAVSSLNPYRRYFQQKKMILLK